MGYLAISTDGGRIVYLLHGSPTSNYTHVGNAVHVGDAIYTTGSNGNSTGPHLHFEVHTSVVGELSVPTGPGDDINPEPWLTGCNVYTPNGQQVTVAPQPNGTSGDLFVRGTDNAAYHAIYDGHNLSAWERLGGVILGAPNASWVSSAELDVFAIGQDHVVYELKQQSGAWDTNWTKLAGSSGSSAREEVTVARVPAGSRLDLFVRGTDGSPYHAVMTGSTLGAWERLGTTQILGAPNASWNGTTPLSATELSAFAIGTDHVVNRNQFTNQWGGWIRLNGASGSAGTEQIGVARIGGVQLDIFLRGTDGAAWHGLLLDGETLSPNSWESLGQAVLGAPTATWLGPLDVFAVDCLTSVVYEDQFANYSWTGWVRLTGTSG